MCVDYRGIMPIRGIEHQIDLIPGASLPNRAPYRTNPEETKEIMRHDRGKGVPSFDEMVDFALVEVDFDDPTTNVRGRRALAIAKPTLRGY